MSIFRQYGRIIAAAFILIGLLGVIAAFLRFNQRITAKIWSDTDATPKTISVSDPIAANWLQKAGIALFPGDTIQYSGVVIPPTFHLPIESGQTLLYNDANNVTFEIDDQKRIFYSSASTLAEALWEQGIVLSGGDRISIPLDTPLTHDLSFEVWSGKPLMITIGKEEIRILSSAATVSETLKDAGIPLMNLDYSIPDVSQSIPSDRIVKVVRVSEEVILEETTIPFSEERIPDDQLVIGQRQVLQSGVNGAQTERIRVRYEDGREISRVIEAEWVSKLPVSQKVAYGTQAVIQTLPEGLDYWLAREVHVLSYHDTGQTTATGIWPYYGVIAVSPEWYQILKGSSIYVPGYGVGTVLDVCPGCSGKNWIDVFIPLEDYVAWSRDMTVYFLPPVPAGFSGDLP